MATKRQRRKRRRRHPTGQGRPTGSAGRVLAGTRSEGQGTRSSRPGYRRVPARRGPDDRPPAPWGSFPLSEVVVFIGILLLVAGFFVSPPQGFVMIAVGLGLGSLAGLELSIREHFAGYRSHTLVLSAAVGAPVFALLLFATDNPVAVCAAVALAAFGAAAWLFTQAFRRRSGGAPFRLRLRG